MTYVPNPVARWLEGRGLRKDMAVPGVAAALAALVCAVLVVPAVLSAAGNNRPPGAGEATP